MDHTFMSSYWRQTPLRPCNLPPKRNVLSPYKGSLGYGSPLCRKSFSVHKQMQLHPIISNLKAVDITALFNLIKLKYLKKKLKSHTCRPTKQWHIYLPTHFVVILVSHFAPSTPLSSVAMRPRSVQIKVANGAASFLTWCFTLLYDPWSLSMVYFASSE